MFLGHFGVGFAGKRIARDVSLGTLLLAAQLADLLWPIFLLLGLEHVRIVPGLMRTSAFDFYDYPISHSLVALIGWACAAAALTFLRRRSRREALVVGVLVVSHWFLDVVVHRRDMPLLPRGPYLGLGLWNSWPATIALDVGLYAAGIAVYLRATRARDRIGVWSLWAFVLFLTAVWIAALSAPPPPDVRTLAVSALVGWLLVAWAFWIDRHRVEIDS